MATTVVGKQTGTPQAKSKKQGKKELKDLPMFKTESEMIKFFDDEKLRRYHFLTYAEYIEIFGKTVDTNFLPKVNKKIIYGHFDYFNYCYDQTWKYKWYPLFGVFALNLRTLAYLYGFDYFFENFSLHRNTNERFIDIRNTFSYHLNKKRCKIFSFIVLFLIVQQNRNHHAIIVQTNHNMFKTQYIFGLFFAILESTLLTLIRITVNYLEKYVQIVNRNIQKNEYKEFKVSKLPTQITIGKNKIPLDDEELEEQKEYDSYTTITNQELQKKEDKILLQHIEKNKLYQTYQKLHFYSKVLISNLQSGVNMNNLLDDFFKVGIYNVLNKVTKSISNFQIEFGKYKQDIGVFPTRGDYFQLLYYKELNQNKVYNFKDLLRERINESIDLYNFMFRNKLTKSFVNINWIHPEHIDVNPTYKINHYLMDFLTFSLICCVPLKVMKFRSKFNQVLLMMRQQKSKYQNV